MLDDRMSLCVVSWWCYDEIGYADHRLAVPDRQEGLRRAVLHSRASDPFAFGVTAEPGHPGDDHDAAARDHPGKIVSTPIGCTGGDGYRVRIAGDPIRHASGVKRMDRFYWTWGE